MTSVPIVRGRPPSNDDPAGAKVYFAARQTFDNNEVEK
jgi:hypothetical protein